jgi:hypothetical protein
MADLALQTPAQELIHKLIVFIFWANLVRGPPSGSAKLWQQHMPPGFGNNNSETTFSGFRHLASSISGFEHARHLHLHGM